MKLRALTLCALVSAMTAGVAEADSIFVAATDGPWSISANPSMPFGRPWIAGDNTDPAVLSLEAGASSVTITYESGTATAGILWPPAGPEGYPYNDVYPIHWGCGPGTSGGMGSQGIFPCHYIDPNNVGPNIWVGALIAAFIDDAGAIVGYPFAPFASSEAPYSVGVPTGATELSFGYNDDIYGDNADGWNIGVAYSQDILPPPPAPPGPSPGVPEPSIWVLLSVGLVSLRFMARRITEAGPVAST